MLPCSDGLAAHSYPVRDDEASALAAWLASEAWPFHARMNWTPEGALEAIRAGDFSGTNPTYWIETERDGRVGIVHYRYMDDVTPDVDLRLAAAFRGRGLGTLMVEWAATNLFTETDKHRLAGETRVDNSAMRRAFLRCRWVEEAHYRQSWPAEDGSWVDSVGYAILRSDWEASRPTRSSQIGRNPEN